MTDSDTIELLQQCDLGIQMAISSIEEVLDDVHSDELRSCLTTSREDHKKLAQQVEQQLDSRGNSGKDPSPMAKGMAWAKTNMKLALDDSDRAIADLLTDGCSMGIKSLTRYLNEYPAAAEEAKSLTHRLIALEEMLQTNLHPYL